MEFYEGDTFLNNTLYRKCLECGKTFPIYKGEQQFCKETPSFELPKRCHRCRDIRKSLKDIELGCKVCGDRFLFTTGEQRFYTKNNLSQPTKCTKCRAIQQTPYDQPKDN